MFWRGVVGYLPVNIVQGVTGLLGIVVFTRLLSPAEFGVYALAFSVTSLVYTLTFTWLEAAMARFYAAEAEGKRLPSHFVTLYQAFAWLALAFPIPMALALAFWPMSSSLKLAVGAGLASIIVRSLVKLTQERRRAAGDVKGAAMTDIATTGGGFLLGAAFAWAGLGGAAPIAGVGVAAAICLVVLLPLELKRLKGGRYEHGRALRYAAYGVPVSLSLILALAIATTDRFVLAAYWGEGAVGVYHAGYSLANRTLDVLFIWLGMAGGPAAVAALERGGKTSLHPVAHEQASFMVALTLPAAVGLALVARPLADVMIGPALRVGAAQVTPWIAGSGFFAGFTTYYLHTAFTLGRRTRRLLVAMAIPALCNLALTLILIPRFGVQGAMWATFAAYALGAVASFWLGRGALALPIPWGAIGRSAVATAGMALAVLAIPAFGGFGELIAKALAGVVTYLALAFALDICGLRSRGLDAVRSLRPRLA
jgi:O-antigen/teichoic acid export membrane protein